MKCVVILIAFISFAQCCIKFNPNRYATEMDETVIPTEIVRNFLYKYLSHEQVSLSFVSMDSNVGRSRFQENLISNLVADPKLSNFSFNILKEVDQTRKGNTNIFNVVIIDGIESLS